MSFVMTIRRHPSMTTADIASSHSLDLKFVEGSNDDPRTISERVVIVEGGFEAALMKLSSEEAVPTELRSKLRNNNNKISNEPRAADLGNRNERMI